jgi:hypothetical protein
VNIKIVNILSITKAYFAYIKRHNYIKVISKLIYNINQ